MESRDYPPIRATILRGRDGIAVPAWSSVHCRSSIAARQVNESVGDFPCEHSTLKYSDPIQHHIQRRRSPAQKAFCRSNPVDWFFVVGALRENVRDTDWRSFPVDHWLATAGVSPAAVIANAPVSTPIIIKPVAISVSKSAKRTSRDVLRQQVPSSKMRKSARGKFARLSAPDTHMPLLYQRRGPNPMASATRKGRDRCFGLQCQSLAGRDQGVHREFGLHPKANRGRRLNIPKITLLFSATIELILHH